MAFVLWVSSPSCLYAYVHIWGVSGTREKGPQAEGCMYTVIVMSAGLNAGGWGWRVGGLDGRQSRLNSTSDSDNFYPL